jgi:hypothetical protein
VRRLVGRNRILRPDRVFRPQGDIIRLGPCVWQVFSAHFGSLIWPPQVVDSSSEVVFGLTYILTYI